MYASSWMLLRPFAAMNGCCGRQRWPRSAAASRALPGTPAGRSPRVPRGSASARPGPRRRPVPRPARRRRRAPPRAARSRSRSDAVLVRRVWSTGPPQAWSARRYVPGAGVFQTAARGLRRSAALQGAGGPAPNQARLRIGRQGGNRGSQTRHRRPGTPKKEEEVSDNRSDDRTWVEAVDRYVARRAPRATQTSGQRPLRAGQRAGAGRDRVTVRDRRHRQRAARGQAQPLQRRRRRARPR